MPDGLDPRQPTTGIAFDESQCLVVFVTPFGDLSVAGGIDHDRRFVASRAYADRPDGLHECRRSNDLQREREEKEYRRCCLDSDHNV